MYSEGGPIVSTYTASYGVPKIAFAMPLSRNMTLDGVTYTGLAVSYDTDVVDDLVDGSMYGGQSDCYIVRANGDIVLALEPQTELCEGMTNLYDIDAHADWKYGSMDDIKDCVQLGRSGSAQFICQGGRNYLVAIPTAFPDWTLVGIIRAEAMTMINRVLCRMPQSESDLLDSMVTWPDNKPSDWHYLAVQEATNSHDFDRQGEVGESWTKLTSVPDWTRYQ